MILDKIKTGEISLSQASLIQKSIREKDKQGNEKILPEQKQELIRNLCSKSMPESQKIIAQNLNLTILTGPKETHQKDEGVRLAVSFSKEDWETLLKARDLLSHAVGSSDWAKVFSYLGKKVVQKSEVTKPKANAKTETETTAKTCANVKTTANVNAQARDGVQTKLKMNEVKCTTFNISVSATEGVAQQKSSNHVRKSIPLNLKKKILNRDKCCQFKNKITGRICNSRWNLEIDHLQPIWANGNNNEENLRVLCGNHNRHVYAKQAHIQPL